MRGSPRRVFHLIIQKGEIDELCGLVEKSPQDALR